MQLRQAILTINGQTHLLTPNRSNSFEALFVDFQKTEEGSGERYSVFLHPKQDVVVQRLEIQFDLPLPPAAKWLANGYQSWSETRVQSAESGIPRLRNIARRRMGLYGDEHIPDIPRGSGYLHSWTYTQVRKGASGDSVLFLGSLNERTGFTLFLYNQSNGILTIRKDMDGLALSHSFPALDFVILEGGEQVVYDAYFQLLDMQPPSAPPAMGWTSRHRTFPDISEEIVLKNLDSFCAFQTENLTLPHSAKSFFQIDDGWQTQVGDWLSVKPAFPGGMGRMASNIKGKGLSPGLWLAPFVADKDSDLVKKHPDWLLKDAQGRPLRVGWNAMWNGWYFALDFYHPAVQEYLAGVFHVVCEKWGYELLKLDVLFAVCLAPPPGKTRGQVMYEAMEFLRRQVGQRRILGCGVPLGSCFGLVDYCRIGGDIHLAWENRLLAFLRHRERRSTLAALRATLARWRLDGRAFLNDPDVFLLCSDHQNLTPAQQETVLILNALLGSLLFTSDDVGQYSPEQTADLTDALAWRGSLVSAVSEIETDVYRIDLEQQGAAYSAWCNLTKRAQNLPTGGKNGDWVALLPFETLVLGR